MTDVLWGSFTAGVLLAVAIDALRLALGPSHLRRRGGVNS